MKFANLFGNGKIEAQAAPIKVANYKDYTRYLFLMHNKQTMR